MAGLTYQSAGVNLELYDEAMRRLPAQMERTRTPRVIPLADAFAGLVRLNRSARPGVHDYEDPVLVSGTDGVGTKLKVAQRAQSFRTVGIDLVGMCVNDCLCLGAEPLFFLDYLALDRDNPDLIADLVAGVADGCVEAGAALIGGETAVMPDVYAAGDFDMAGFCVGVVERSRIVDGQAIRPGDVLIGVSSSGFHSNGYSLIRRVVFESAKCQLDDAVPGTPDTVRDVLLRPTRIYAKLVAAVLAAFAPSVAVTGMAHITGGGLVDNIARLLPTGCRAKIDRTRWTPSPAFEWLSRIGPIDRDEMYRVFNMGLGYVFIVRPNAAGGLFQLLQQRGESPVVIGEIAAGDAGAEYIA